MSLREKLDLKRHLRDADTSMIGDSSDTGLAMSALAEALSTGGKLGAGIQKKNEDEAAAKKAKEAADKASAQHDVDVKAATDARNAATKAKMDAAKETDVNGPLHYLAIVAEQKATAAESKAGVGASAYSGPTPRNGGGGGMPVWGWALIGVAGVGLLGTTVALAVRKKR